MNEMDVNANFEVQQPDFRVRVYDIKKLFILKKIELNKGYNLSIFFFNTDFKNEIKRLQLKDTRLICIIHDENRLVNI